MITKRAKPRSQKSQQNKIIEKKDLIERPRKEKIADFLIDVAKYVFTGVVITSLFNDVTNKTFLYLVGMFIVLCSLVIGLVLTNKRKEN